MNIWAVMTLVVIGCAVWPLLRMVRWGRRMPTTVEGWTEGSRRQDAAFRRAVPEVATECGLHDVASRAASFTGEWFPAAEFLQEMPHSVQKKVMRRARSLAETARQHSG